MSNLIFFDIEVIPRPLSDEKREEYLAAWQPPKNIKDPEKIEARKAKYEAELHEKLMFRGWNQIVSIAAAVDDRMVECKCNPHEDGLIHWFFDSVSGIDNPRFVGFNIRGFDFLSLAAAAMRHDKAMTRRVHRNQLIDLFDWPLNKQYSLREACQIFGTAQKMQGMDGSKVKDLWFAENYDTIREYNMRDVEITRDLYYQLSRVYEL